MRTYRPRLHHYLYVTHCLVYFRRVYRRANCKCDNAYSLGLYRDHIARHRRFRRRRVDCATVLQTIGGFQISSRRIFHVDRRRDCSRLSRATYRLGLAVWPQLVEAATTAELALGKVFALDIPS
jgi:hypothetical protein